MRPVQVRVVYPEEDREMGWIISVVAGICTLLLMSNSAREIFGLSPFVALSAVGGAWACGTVLTWRRPPEVSIASIEDGTLVLGQRRFVPGTGVDVSVARGAHGFSVAISRFRKRDGIFLEVATEFDARAIVSALRASWPKDGVVEMRVRRDRVRLAQRLLGLFGVLCWIGYGVGREIYEDKSFGLPALFLSVASSVLFVLDSGLRRTLRIGTEIDLRAGNNPIDAHAKLHVDHPVVADEVPSVRVRVLARADETTSAWLTRLDAMNAGDGYRCASITAEELWGVLDDENRPDDERLGAARVLARQHRTAAADLRARARALPIDAALRTDPEAAASALEARGPAFRVKR